MGVLNLWKLLQPCGRRVAVETLRGQILAVDVSIWLTQFIKAMRDDEGQMAKNAHLVGTFRRICKVGEMRRKRRRSNFRLAYCNLTALWS
jgi:DNA excision repair protein ERCC-5